MLTYSTVLLSAFSSTKKSMKVTQQQNLTLLRSSPSSRRIANLTTKSPCRETPKVTTSPPTSNMATRIACRAAFRRNVVPVTLGLTTTFALAARQQPLKLDALSSSQQSRSLHSQKDNKEEWLNPETIKQLSSGSLSGFATGLLISVFSKTLVLLAGVGMVLVQVASRYGIDLVGMLHLRDKVNSSKILKALQHKMAFKLAFAITFALSAFMSF
ncbi:hypothetical protein GE21DRAFT_4393 [Neurospora crassa]|uniref:Uncharacterized protein n=1 Tax=Neurospora crassa (strain ATCC 24698 / 74-OR23-1A / CBS 708.71 / DSM 1257 / FGSC 987) TaxID=367110 RepID=Q7RYL7_NEUCR|nr:hypothetical protein NCU00111 [Neurospora crassa OR74A]EAA27999.3 hypothetical protein NCU00111 [Neurospora crassa OR74A]KHE89493.1 hypothetical protein GE21DRAFT_4393 [Neurospora crassa]|eukprot:XP_957235.3 hypothetical protein NCU00111 [Neurospora crassa OR74A]